MEAAPLTTGDLWQSLHADLGAFIRRRVGQGALADDLLQETFVRIHRGLGGLDDGARVGAWAYRIARNVVTDHLRGRRREEPLDADREVAAPQPEPSNDAAQLLGAWLQSMIPQLPETYREAVHLAEVDGLTHAEIAAALGLSVSGAKSRVQRGRAHLRRMARRCCELALDARGRVIDLRCRDRGCE